MSKIKMTQKKFLENIYNKMKLNTRIKLFTKKNWLLLKK